MAHALHPNYSDKHDPEHGPELHRGLVIKHNANQRYATSAVTAAVFREIARARGIPCQVRAARRSRDRTPRSTRVPRPQQPM